MIRKLLILQFLILTLTCSSQVKTKISFGGNMTGGNFNSFSTNLESTISKDSGKVVWSVNPSFIYGMVKFIDYKINQRESYVSLSVSRKWSKWRVLYFSDFENSYLKKVLFRGSMGFGVGNDIINNGKHRLLISELCMPEFYYSEIDKSKNITSVRLSTRIRYEYKGKIEISSITLIQPSIYSKTVTGFKNNINGRSVNSVTVPLNKRLNIGLGLTCNLSTYSTFVDNDVEPVDWNSSLLLKYKF
jgi:hypothetical protein